MPDDTDKAQRLRSDQRHKDHQLELDEGLQRLINYVELKATQESVNAVVDFPRTAEACSLLFSRFIVHQSRLHKTALADFLDVLCNAETYRLYITERAEAALTWHTYYKKNDPEGALSDKEVEELEQIFKARDDWRIVYMKIVKKTMALDLFYLFTSNPWSLTDYFVRLLEYYPSSFKPTKDHEACPRHFVKFLSRQEKKMLLETGERSLLFVEESVKWLKKRPADVHILDALHSEEFSRRYGPPTDLGRLDNLLHYYLKHITTIYNTITAIFPTQPQHQLSTSQLP